MTSPISPHEGRVWKGGLAFVFQSSDMRSQRCDSRRFFFKDWHLVQDADPYSTIARVMYAPRF